MHRRQHCTPALRDANHGATGRQRSDQPVQNTLHAGNQVSGCEQPHRVHIQPREGERILLHRVALVFEENHDHRDAKEHLRNWAEKVAAKHLKHWRLELSK